MRLPVNTAGVEIGAAGRCWIMENLHNEPVYLRLIRRDRHHMDTVQAELFALRVRLYHIFISEISLFTGQRLTTTCACVQRQS